MLSAFEMGFMQRALAAGMLIAALCALFSVFVVLKRLSFIGVGISHSAFGGVALGFLLGIEPTVTAVVFSAAVALLIGFVNRRGKLHEDTAIGIFFALTMALGILFIGLSGRYNVDLFGYLFGNILAIGRGDLIFIAIVAPVIFILVFSLFKELLFLSFDEEVAQVSGVPVTQVYYLFLAAMAVTIVIAIKLIGIVLVSALLVLPAATARQMTRSIRGMLIGAITVAVVVTAIGLFLSYQLDLASGATIVLLAGALFFLSLLYSNIRGMGAARR
jgi:ABC-type Mn2+/Zn2+ transport system permease subunit